MCCCCRRIEEAEEEARFWRNYAALYPFALSTEKPVPPLTIPAQRRPDERRQPKRR